MSALRWTRGLRMALWLALLGAATACSSRTLDQADGGDEDLAGSGSSSDGPRGPECSPTHACPTGRVCYNHKCVPDNGRCCSDDECLNDTRCSSQAGDGGMCGVCLEYQSGQYDPMCQGQGFSASEFAAPVDRCHWPLAGMNPLAREVVMTPIVLDLDGDRQPEIVFAPQIGSGVERLVAIHGKDCTQVFDVDAQLEAFSQIAAGDLDGDGKPEIVGVLTGTSGAGHKLAVFSGQTGAKLAESPQPYNLSGTSFDCSGPAIADVDGDGQPEVIAAGMVTRYNKAGGTLDILWNNAVPGGTWGTLSLANDMDGDGKLEVISGTKIFDGVTGKDKTPPVMAALGTGGYPAIGDFNGDGWPDIVFIQSQRDNQQVAIVDVKNNAFLMGPLPVPGGWGGPPTVADFDGDGKPEFGTAGPRNYFVFSPDCMKSPKPAKCAGAAAGVLWQSSTKDASSGGTASSVFDFNGDGRAEVVYRDECWLRVYNGSDGKTVFARPITSGTALEMPVVADVDGDGHADLIVPSDAIQGTGYCADQSPEATTKLPHTGTTNGVFVLRDPMNRWMPSRSMWNQHTYHITNVNDDGRIPRAELPNWKSYNNYRQNVQGAAGMPIPQGDATARILTPLDQGDCVQKWKLWGEICNRGSGPYAAGLPGSFYNADPRLGGTPICTARTTQALTPGKCEAVNCLWNNPPRTSQDLWFRVNDDGTGGRPETQCKNKNDLAYLKAVTCGNTPG